jgi:hypothetical protein
MSLERLRWPLICSARGGFDPVFVVKKEEGDGCVTGRRVRPGEHNYDCKFEGTSKNVIPAQAGIQYF